MPDIFFAGAPEARPGRLAGVAGGAVRVSDNGEDAGASGGACLGRMGCAWTCARGMGRMGHASALLAGRAFVQGMQGCAQHAPYHVCHLPPIHAPMQAVVMAGVLAVTMRLNLKTSTCQKTSAPCFSTLGGEWGKSFPPTAFFPTNRFLSLSVSVLVYFCSLSV